VKRLRSQRTERETTGWVDRLRTWQIESDDAWDLPWHKAIDLYIADLARRGRRPNTIRTVQSLLASEAVRQGLEVSIDRTIWQIAQRQEAIAGVKGEVRAKPLRAAALRSVMERLAEVIAETPYPVQRLLAIQRRAMVSLGWAGALRVSELCQLQRGDLRADAEGYAITIRHSKTDQLGLGAVVVVPRHELLERCPCASIDAWLAELPDDGPAIWRRVLPNSHMSRSETAYVSAMALELAAVTRGVCAAMALAGPGYTSHSMRAGWVTEAAQCGVTDSALMLHSRHSSPDIMRRYIRPARVWESRAPFDVMRQV
jgi:integrase